MMPRSFVVALLQEERQAHTAIRGEAVGVKDRRSKVDFGSSGRKISLKLHLNMVNTIRILGKGIMGPWKWLDACFPTKEINASVLCLCGFRPTTHRTRGLQLLTLIS